MDLCEICKENIGVPITTTVGGYIVVACTRCRRHYHEFAIQNEEIVAYELEKGTVEALVVLGDKDALPRLEKLFEQRIEVYRVVEGWMAHQRYIYAFT